MTTTTGDATRTRDSVRVIATRWLTPVIAAAAALAVWELGRTGGSSQVVIGRFGAQWLSLAAGGVALLAGTHAVIAWTYRWTRRARGHGGAAGIAAVAVRGVVTLVSCSIWLLGMAALGFATLFGYPSAFVTVGSVSGHAIVVEANSSLAGLAVSAGVRDGLLVTFPRSGESTWSQDGQASGFRPVDPANYRLEVRGDTAIVHFRVTPSTPLDHSVSLPLSAITRAER
ncbi:hypothetical protein GCM10025867_06290 [Frondihabitans sucicola]|uniref:Uncharacterized protein n=1 Tax=Frondihabitans sucicola TaxID=1268041 RepID=A0ABN6XTX3_9MICO|nr:hypothetical protein [Frondihabitans sucicola]BDZ48388.1 hypothetical protein GCM10025867_06290 [Frondihabitans sucicola]